MFEVIKQRLAPTPAYLPGFPARFALGNRVRALNFGEFAAMGVAFHHLASEAFGVACDVQVRAYRGIPLYADLYTTKEEIDAINKPITLADESILDDHWRRKELWVRHGIDTPALPMYSLWQGAYYMELSVKPLFENAQGVPPSAWAIAEFKGRQRNYASFYVQGDEPGHHVLQGLKEWGKGFAFAPYMKDHK